MCGVIGFISKNGSSVNDVFEGNYSSILDRGKYFNKIETLDSCYGYARLPTDAINNRDIDKIQGEGSNHLLYNGIITNTDDLHKMYSLPVVAKASDTLCLYHGYSQHGKAFLQSLRGMFAFAYVTENQITLVRDTIGIKPLYYINTKDVFGFCSEMKGLVNQTNAEIHEVLTGQIITFDRLTNTLKKENFSFRSYRNYSKQDLHKCLIETVVAPTKRYLDQSEDKKVGLLISGGVDSSIIAALLAKNLSNDHKKRLVGFCLGTDTAEDIKMADKLTQQLGIKLIHVKPYTNEETVDKIQDVVYNVESNYGRVIKLALLQDALAQKVHEEGIEVVLGGEGADELFYGYNKFITDLKDQEIDEMFTYFFKNIFYFYILQRFERLFAKRQIEGRVPLLDQELVELSKKFSVDEKITRSSDGVYVKVPLREVAKEIGLPEYIYARKKMQMTIGATTKVNEDIAKGYLEDFLMKTKNESLRQIVESTYSEHFPNVNLARTKKQSDLDIKMSKHLGI